jgi:hypothetical protein
LLKPTQYQYDNHVTVHNVLIQYQARILELQTSIAQLRLHHLMNLCLLALAVTLFLALGLYAIRGQISFLWSPLPIPVVAASARRFQQSRQSNARQRGAIGALSTHDLALTEIAGADGLRGVNMHMGSRQQTDPMDFDTGSSPA